MALDVIGAQFHLSADRGWAIEDAAGSLVWLRMLRILWMAGRTDGRYEELVEYVARIYCCCCSM